MILILTQQMLWADDPLVQSTCLCPSLHQVTCPLLFEQKHSLLKLSQGNLDDTGLLGSGLIWHLTMTQHLMTWHLMIWHLMTWHMMTWHTL